MHRHLGRGRKLAQVPARVPRLVQVILQGDCEMKRKSYTVQTTDFGLETTNSLEAAREFVRLLRDGARPVAHVMIERDTNCSIERVWGWSFNVREMQQFLVQKAKYLLQ
jgi:hypothetical protein